MLFNVFGERRSLENPKKSLTDPANWFGTSADTASGISVSEAEALGIPAVWQAVNLISSTIANLPLHLYKRDKEGNTEKAVTDPLYMVVHDRANDVHTKSQFFKWWIWRALAGSKGRGLALILRNGAGRAMGFLPLPEDQVTIEQSIVNRNLVRTYTTGGKIYPSSDILDLAPVLDPNGKDALSPIIMNKNAIASMIATERFTSNLLANGGVPPLSYSSSGSPAAQDRAVEQMSAVLSMSRDRKRPILPLPAGHELKPIGFNPSEQQMLELRKHQISEVSRIYNIAPALLYDLTTGTYSNVEQQSLSFATQTILPLIKMIEQEMNAKLFSSRNGANFVEFNVDGMVRGDLKSRMDALARAVNSGLRTPNEGRAMDNLPAKEGGDQLFIQGATVPLAQAGMQTVTPTVTANDPGDDAQDDQAAE